MRSKDCINNHSANKGLFEYFKSFCVWALQQHNCAHSLMVHYIFLCPRNYSISIASRVLGVCVSAVSFLVSRLLLLLFFSSSWLSGSLSTVINIIYIFVSMWLGFDMIFFNKLLKVIHIFLFLFAERALIVRTCFPLWWTSMALYWLNKRILFFRSEPIN